MVLDEDQIHTSRGSLSERSILKEKSITNMSNSTALLGHKMLDSQSIHHKEDFLLVATRSRVRKEVARQH